MDKIVSNLIQLQSGYKAYSARILFDEASFSINENEHVGVVGPNGAGKTTLFKILIGAESLDEGEIVQSKRLKLGYLAQHDTWKESDTVEDYLSQGCVTPLWELKPLGEGLGLTQEIYSQPIVSLSGGYRMRCKLLHLLGEEPNLLLLDEPTNYLDLESLIVLENFLRNFNGSFLLISHDREFLRRTTDYILEVEGQCITKFNVGLDEYFEQKALLRQQLEARAMSIEEKRKEIIDFVNRFGAKASKASQAQSRLKGLSKLEQIEIKPLAQGARIPLPPPIRTGKVILKVGKADLGYETKTVLKKVDFQLMRGEHLAIVGVNGAGKSTLLKALSGRLKPLNGEIQLGLDVSIGYYAQHVSEALDPDKSVLESLHDMAHEEILPQQILAVAGALLFQKDDVRKKIRVLSGGEKARVALGQILLQKAPCLILDEPTNHLDFQTVEALTHALKNYEGSVVTVSHDRSFIRQVASKILEVKDGTVNLYYGTYDEYVWSLQKGTLSQSNQGEPSSTRTVGTKKNPVPNIKTSDSSPVVNSQKELKAIERDMSATEKETAVLQKKLNEINHNLISDPNSHEQKKWISDMGEVQSKLHDLEEKWMKLYERKTLIS